MSTAPNPVASLWRAKHRRRRALAALPLNEKLKILLRLQRLASEIGRAVGRASPPPWDRPPMIIEPALKVLKRLQRDGVIDRYAMGGAFATLFYMEPILTSDLDVFVFSSPSRRPVRWPHGWPSTSMYERAAM